MPPSPAAEPRSIFRKIWDAHVVTHLDDGRDLIFVDRHVLQETTSARAFDGLRQRNLSVRHPELTIATQDHILSTAPGRTEETNPDGRELLELMRKNAFSQKVRHFGLGDPRQGIVHVIGPELGFALPGTVVACGDSHTSTVGGIGAIGIGVGTSEVEHILATQTLTMPRPKAMRIVFEGRLSRGISSKDLILRAIGQLGISAGQGHAVEYAGPAIRALPLEARLTICNMSIELGARLGLIAPDESTFAYVSGREYSPQGADLDQAIAHWHTLQTDDGATFDKDVVVDCEGIAPQVTWGTTQEEVIGVDARLPDPGSLSDTGRRNRAAKALAYMGLQPGMSIEGLPIDIAFIGSCTNSRLSDLEVAADVVKGHRVAPNVRALVVPGSMSVKRAAEQRGIDRIFRDAGFEWREAGCSMCVSINEDIVAPGQRCLATSNRNFENRQGPGSRTHLASPAMVAAGAIAGKITDVRKVLQA
ncbi:3-isopropylmalate dehydratase large subunit [Leptospira interrogans]